MRSRPSAWNAPSLWKLSENQHGVTTRQQLLGLGLSGAAIAHGLGNGRLHPVHRGIYAIGRPQLERNGRWLAAVLACGRRAALSHRSAAALWGLPCGERDRIEVSVPPEVNRRRPGLIVHRRSGLRRRDIAKRNGIPVTTPSRTLLDIAPALTTSQLEAAISEADKLSLVRPEELKAILAGESGAAGAPKLRELLAAQAFALTDSELERRFLRLVRRAGLPKPLTRAAIAGHRADFYWPDLGLVVETDGLRYHRTAAQQARDRRRDQAYALAGLTALRFTHAQVANEADRVANTLRAVAGRLGTTNR